MSTEPFRQLVLRIVFGVALIIAAWLKSGEPAHVPSFALTADGLLPSASIWLVEYEFLLGLWLLSGVARKAAVVVSAATLMLFTFAACHAWMTQQESCGCLGRTGVPPEYVVVFDISMLGLCLSTLIGLRQRPGQSLNQLQAEAGESP